MDSGIAAARPLKTPRASTIQLYCTIFRPGGGICHDIGMANGIFDILLAYQADRHSAWLPVDVRYDWIGGKSLHLHRTPHNI